MKTIAAFFDIDGTLFRDALSVELFKKLSKNNIIAPEKWHNEVKPIYNKWVTRTGNYDDYIEIISKVYRESIHGQKKAIIEFLAKQVIDEKGDRLFRYTKEKLAWHKKQGHEVFIISGASYELTSMLAKKLGIKNFRGTEFLTDENDVYSGGIIPMWDSKSKERALYTFVQNFNIDLDASYAYGDTNGDSIMLNAVGHPTAINPTRELIQNILDTPSLLDKVTTVIERKDVIYGIDLKQVKILN